MPSEVRIYVYKGRIHVHIIDLSKRATLDDLLNDDKKRDSFCAAHPDSEDDVFIFRGMKRDGTLYGYDKREKDEAKRRLEGILGVGQTSKGDWYVYEEDGRKRFLSNDGGFSPSDVELLLPTPVIIYPEGNEEPQSAVLKWINVNHKSDRYVYGRCGECGKKCKGKVVCGIPFCLKHGHRMESAEFEGTMKEVKGHITDHMHQAADTTQRGVPDSIPPVGRFIYSESKSYGTNDADVRELHQLMYSENKIRMAFRRDGEGRYAPTKPYRTYMESITEGPYSRIGLLLDSLCQTLNDEGLNIDFFFYKFMIDYELADRGSPLIYRIGRKVVKINGTKQYIEALFTEPDDVAEQLYNDFTRIIETGLLKSKDGTQYRYETLPYIIYEWTGRFSFRDGSGRVVDFGTDYFDHIHETGSGADDRLYMLDKVIAADPQFKTAIYGTYSINKRSFEEAENDYERMFLWSFLTSGRKRIRYKSIEISNDRSGISEIEKIVVDAYVDPSEDNKQRYMDLCELSRCGSLCDQFKGLKGDLELKDSNGNVTLSIPDIMGYVGGKSMADKGGIPNMELYLTCASLMGGNRMDIRIAYGGRVCKLSEQLSCIIAANTGDNAVQGFLGDPVIIKAEDYIMGMLGPGAMEELKDRTDKFWEETRSKISNANAAFDEEIRRLISTVR